MKILDATCGQKSIWYQKNHPCALFLDKRRERIYTKSSGIKFRDARIITVEPDVIAQWEHMPFKDNVFDMVVFDPPHKIENRGIKKAELHHQYGRLYRDNWGIVLSKGIKELFRILKDDGVLIFKWCESDRRLKDVLKYFPYKPLFGTKTGQQNKNHWVCFIKYDVNMKLDELIT